MNNSTVAPNQRRRRPKFQRNDKRNPHDKKRRRPEYLGEGLTVKVIYRGDSEEEKMKSVEKALSQFKKLLNKEGVFQEIKDRQYFVSPSRKRYLKRKQTIYKQKTDQMKKEKKFRKKR